MAKPSSRPLFPQIAYLAVFGAFTVLSIFQLINGTATKLTWFSLGIAALLFAVTAYRLFRDLTRPDV